MVIDLAFIWAGIIAFAVLAYVILDGFDLGVGILFPFFPHKHDRDVMMNSVAPVWDGNETWLVLGGGGLMAVFPLAYATILPALYAPIIAMLLGLIFRGVAFEYRWRTKRAEYLWNWAFAGGSMLAAFAQGVALGALVQGIPVVDRAYAGGWWDWLTPFLAGHRSGAGDWLCTSWRHVAGHEDGRGIGREGEGPVAQTGDCYHCGHGCFQPLDAVSRAALSLPVVRLSHHDLLDHRSASGAGLPLSALHGLRNERDTQPFLASLGLFVLGYAGIGISFYPYIVPTSLTIWEAAAPDESLAFLLVGAVVLVPIILIYTGYAYWVFRGKINPEEGYH